MSLPVNPGDRILAADINALNAAAAAAAATANAALTPAQGNSTYRKLRAGNRFALIGDSITLLNDGPPTIPTYTRNRGFFTWGAYFLGQRCDLVNDAGVIGNTSTQMLARFTADIAGIVSDWVFVLAGANDVTNDVAAATTIANLDALYTAAEGLGRRVGVATVMPTTSANTLARQQALATVNDWIRKTARERGYPCADFYAAIVDPTTGFAQTGLTIDGVHPTTQGAIRLGAAFADAFDKVLPPVRFAGTSNTDAGNLVTNGSMAGAASGVATSWTVSGSVSTVLKYKQPRLDLPGFEWQVFEFGPGSTGDLSFFFTTAAASVAPTDVLEGYCELDCQDIVSAAGGYIDFRVISRKSDGTQLAQASAAYPDQADSLDFPGRGVLKTGRITAGALADNALVQVFIHGVDEGIVRVGRVLARKVV